MLSHGIRFIALCLAPVGLLQTAAVAVEPVEALRPSASAREARPVIVETSLRILTLYQGQRAGMLKGHEAPNLISREIEKLRKNEAVLAFLRDESVSDDDRSERICRWVMKRPLKEKERTIIRKALAETKDRPAKYIDLIWSFTSTREFQWGK